MFKRLIASLVCLTFSFSNLQYAHAQDFSINQLPVPGTMVGVSSPFAPLALKGLIVNPQKPLEFQFIVDTGESLPKSMSSPNALIGDPQQEQLRQQANQLIKYFLAGLTIPEGDLWVNLSPYEKDRMVPEALGQTDLGRDLLAQDYILKQLTASLIYPEKDLGKEFWSRVYAKAQQQFGTTNVPVNTFNKVWILPNQAQVFENGNAAYVTKSTLKVMLDEDYLALFHNVIPEFPTVIPAKAGIQNKNDINKLGSQIVRQIILPEIEKEVNTGKNFAPLRQIYQALILAKWYKETISNGLLDAIYTNKNKVAGVNLNDPAVKEQIYNRYLQAYKKGAFNYIKEDPTPDGQVVPRKYFSGGTRMIIQIDPTGKESDIKGPDGAMISLTIALVAAGAAAIVGGYFFIKPSKIESILSGDTIQMDSKLAEYLAKQNFDTLIKLLQYKPPSYIHHEGDLYLATIKALEKLEDKRAIEPLLQMLKNVYVYEVAREALIKLGASKKQLLDGYTAALLSTKFSLRKNAAEHLISLGGYEYEDVLKRLLQRNPQGAREDILDFFLREAIQFKKEGYDFKVVFEPGKYEQGQPSSLEDSYSSHWNVEITIKEEILRIERGDKLPDSAMLQTPQQTQEAVMFAKTRIAAWKLTGNVDKILIMLSDGDESVRLAAEKALAKLGVSKEQMFNAYIAALSSAHIPAKINAVKKLGDLGDKRAIEKLLKMLDDVAYEDAEKALAKLGASKEQMVNAYRIALSSAYIPAKINAIKKLGGLGDKRAIEPLIRLLKDKYLYKITEEALAKLEASKEQMLNGYLAVLLVPSGGWNFYYNAIEKLGDLGDKRAIEPLIGLLKDERYYKAAEKALLRLEASKEQIINGYIAALPFGGIKFYEDVMGKSGKLESLGASPEQMVDGYIAALSAKDDYIREDAVKKLGALGDKRAIDPLKELLKNWSSHLSAEDALIQLGVKREEIFEFYIKDLSSGDPHLVEHAIQRLGDYSGKERAVAIEKLFGLLENIKFRVFVEDALTKLGADRERMFKAFITDLSPGEDPKFIIHAIENLPKFSGQHLDAIKALRGVKDERYSRAVKESLARLGVRVSTDKAALAKDLGGIDLNQINVNRTGKTVKVQFDQAQLNELLQGGFEGFTPVIINITHISSPFQLLGIGTAKKEELSVKV